MSYYVSQQMEMMSLRTMMRTLNTGFTGDARFSYNDAFSRNIGWVTEPEQKKLRGKRVAIAGLGGVGGSHAVTLARLGIGAMNLADLDSFDVANFNRQAGASMSTLGRQKSEVLANMVRDINPEVDVRVYPEGVTPANIDAFLAGVDLYVDGLDFYAFSARRLVFAECAKRQIPATTVAPLGMGAAMLNFVPGGMTFEEYFRWDDCSEEEMAVRFLVGLSPALVQRTYLADPNSVSFVERRNPSTGMACQICAGIAATQAVKILLDRGPLIVAPRGMHFDAYRNKLVTTWRPFGNANPLQRLLIAIARPRLLRRGSSQEPA